MTLQSRFIVPNVNSCTFFRFHTPSKGKLRWCHFGVFKKGFQDNIHALGSVRARSNNRDGDAIYAVAKRMRNLTENQGILFVLSDGQPAARVPRGCEAEGPVRLPREAEKRRRLRGRGGRDAPGVGVEEDDVPRPRVPVVVVS